MGRCAPCAGGPLDPPRIPTSDYPSIDWEARTRPSQLRWGGGGDAPYSDPLTVQGGVETFGFLVAADPQADQGVDDLEHHPGGDGAEDADGGRHRAGSGSAAVAVDQPDRLALVDVVDREPGGEHARPGWCRRCRRRREHRRRRASRRSPGGSSATDAQVADQAGDDADDQRRPRLDKAGGRVMVPTSPATAPDGMPSTDRLAAARPFDRHPHQAATAAEMWVFSMALPASSPDASADPALKPNQPTHSRTCRSGSASRLCGAMLSVRCRSLGGGRSRGSRRGRRCRR